MTPAAFARELAAALTRDQAAATIGRWRAVVSAAEIPARHGVATGGVGIWRPARLDGRTWFVREAGAREARSWADVACIAPKRGPRVALLGESCARAWPLDPFFNCASALRTCLQAHAADLEVVDLARLGLTAPALLETLEASRVLEPDVYVIFAGNNWTVHAARAHLREMAAVAHRGWRAVAAVCAEAVRAQIGAWTRALAQILGDGGGARAVVVVPAENIRDFPLAPRLSNPLLASDEQIVRDRLVARITELQAAGRLAESEPLASDLVALEDRCSIVGLQALAGAALARGEVGEARRLFEEARELLICFPACGMSSYLTRNGEMRRVAGAAGLPIVDLPRLFTALAGGAPPGRDWFYDDCHMTARAVVAAMGAVADAVLPLLGLPSRPAAVKEVAIDPRAEAQADCVAALVNGHDERRVGAYLSSALTRSPELHEVLRHYLELRLSRAPRVLSPAFHRLRELQGRFPALRYLDAHLNDHARPNYQRDARQTRVLARALAAGDPGAPGRCAALLRRKYAGARRAVDLLDGGSHEDADALEQRPGGPERAYVGCHRQHVRFHVLRTSSSGRRRIRLTTRARHRGSIGKVAALLVNATVAATWPMSEEWTTVELACDLPDAEGDADELTIVWPDPGEGRDERARHAARALEDSASGSELLVRAYTVWGEIQAFVVSVDVAALDAAVPAVAAASGPSA